MTVLADWQTRKISTGIFLILRVYLGVYLIQTGWFKVRQDLGLGFADRVTSFAEEFIGRSWGFYRGFLEGVVLPNPELFAVLVTWGEFLAGIALLIGLLTPVAALVVIFINLNFALAVGQNFYSFDLHLLVIYAALCVLLAKTGRVWGVDYWLNRNRAATGLW